MPISEKVIRDIKAAEKSEHEKVFEIEGGLFTLNEFLHVNTHPNQPPLDEEYLRDLLNLQVGEKLCDKHDPNVPVVERVR